MPSSQSILLVFKAILVPRLFQGSHLGRPADGYLDERKLLGKV